MKIVFATSNPHKVAEVSAILAPLGIELASLDERGTALAEPVEDGDTFAANARLKARYYAQHLGVACLAEDSGLVVDALDGAPGIYSARYSGTEGSRHDRDRANNAKLLAALQGVPRDRRTARFVCALCLCEPAGQVLAEASGTYEGLIAEQPSGDGGFGYDPLLYLPDRGCTSAELSAEEKNARSHRGAALRELSGKLRELRSRESSG